jgi:hypothetical protein
MCLTNRMLNSLQIVLLSPPCDWQARAWVANAPAGPLCSSLLQATSNCPLREVGEEINGRRS